MAAGAEKNEYLIIFIISQRSQLVGGLQCRPAKTTATLRNTWNSQAAAGGALRDGGGAGGEIPPLRSGRGGCPKFGQKIPTWIISVSFLNLGISIPRRCREKSGQLEHRWKAIVGARVGDNFFSQAREAREISGKNKKIKSKKIFPKNPEKFF